MEIATWKVINNKTDTDNVHIKQQLQSSRNQQ